MNRTRNRPSACAVGALALLSLALLGRAPARADPVTVRLDATFEVTPAGDRRARIEIGWPEAMYPEIKKRSPDARRFLRDLAPDRADYEMTDTAARYDDASRSVVLEMTERAAAKNLGGGRWQLEPEETATLERTTPEGSPQPKAWFRVKGDWGGGLLYEGEFACALPPGATEVSWDEHSKVLSWRLASPAGAGQPRLTADLHARDRIMSTIYKVYGLGTDVSAFWLAKTVFKNEGKGVARNLRVRYQLQNYGSWSPWQKHPEVVPGQTVVSVLYPVLDAGIAKLKSNTPANLLLEYSYEDETGRRIEDDDSKKIVILGVNEFVFGNLVQGSGFGTWQEDYNNAPLLAAWVTRNDGAVKQFAAMANRLAGGLGASQSDENALRVLRACYELLRANDFTYQHPPALRDRSVSFDPKDVQNVKFPRETMRDRSGTCIDLAILYAAMVNAVGLKPRLALVPGHCFPLVTLPSGRTVGVETTGVMGGIRMGSAPFEKVQPYGDEEYRKAQEDGRIYEVDVHSLWTRGISNPELDDLPADILERWGLGEEGRGHSRTPPGPGPDAPPASDGSEEKVRGSWGGEMPHAKLSEKVILDELYVDVPATVGWSAFVRMECTVLKDDARIPVTVRASYANGSVEAGSIHFEKVAWKRSVPSTGQADDLDGNPLVLRVDEKGKLAGRFEGGDGWPFSLLRRDGSPAPSGRTTPAADDFHDLGASWGGAFNDAKINDTLLIRDGVIDLARKPTANVWAASFRATFVVKTAGGDVLVTIEGSYLDGNPDGDAIKFPSAKLTRTVLSTGAQNPMDGNPLEVRREPDGRLEVRFVGEGGFTLTMSRRN